MHLQYKKEHPEAIQNEVVGQAHMEHYTLQIFLYADNEDRAGRFGKLVFIINVTYTKAPSALTKQFLRGGKLGYQPFFAGI